MKGWGVVAGAAKPYMMAEVPEADAPKPKRSHHTAGHRNKSISMDVRADWSEAYALVPSLQVGHVWHASIHTLEVLSGLQAIGFELAGQIILEGGPSDPEAGAPLRPGEAVYEPFSGSGTTLMAAETLGRRGHAMEIEPKYVQVPDRRGARWPAAKWMSPTWTPAFYGVLGRSAGTQRLDDGNRFARASARLTAWRPPVTVLISSAGLSAGRTGSGRTSMTWAARRSPGEIRPARSVASQVFASGRVA